MGKFKRTVGRWTEEMQATLERIYGAEDLQSFISRRVEMKMSTLAGHRTGYYVPRQSKVQAVADALGITVRCVSDRIGTMIVQAMEGRVGSEERTDRRKTLREYARAGIRTLAEIRAEDARREAKPTAPTPIALPLPEPKPAAPVDEFAELRAARQVYREAKAAFLAAGKMADEADDAANAAHTALDAASDVWNEASRNLESIINRIREVE